MTEPRRINAVSARACTLRDAEPADRPFLLALHASTRASELARTGWSPETRQVFVQMQFEAQQADYLRRHPGSRCQVIDSGEGPVGRLWVARGDDCFHVLDISLIPALRGCGIGGACLRTVLDAARDEQVDVRLHVAVGNPARRLYERLGFVAIGLPGLHQAMTWTPPPGARRVACANDLNDSLEMHDEQA
jgi:ribosomal protein S18 acetylase RimI-like enzyme